MKQTIRQPEELYDALINSFAHELRTPLTAITGAIELLADNDQTLSEEHRREMLMVAFDETKRLNSLIGNMLLDARLSTGVIGVQKQETLLSGIVRKVVSRVQAATVHIQLDLQEELPLAMLDAALIEQAIHNLIHHTLRRSKGEMVSIRLFVKDQEIIFEISHCGRAIPPGHEQLIFDNLYYATYGTTDELGIALSLSRKIIEVHEGRVWSANLPNSEVCFGFALPIIDYVIED